MPTDPEKCSKTSGKHDWRLYDVRTLQGVRPPVTVKEWQCEHCHRRMTTEDPLI